MIPGVKLNHKPSKESAQAYYEMEGNCNTCKHLQRVKHDKDQFGFMQGRCGANPAGHMFVMKFHPHDPMHMRCYQDRITGNRCTAVIWEEERIGSVSNVVTTCTEAASNKVALEGELLSERQYQAECLAKAIRDSEEHKLRVAEHQRYVDDQRRRHNLVMQSMTLSMQLQILRGLAGK